MHSRNQTRFFSGPALCDHSFPHLVFIELFLSHCMLVNEAIRVDSCQSEASHLTDFKLPMTPILPMRSGKDGLPAFFRLTSL